MITFYQMSITRKLSDVLSNSFNRFYPIIIITTVVYFYVSYKSSIDIKYLVRNWHLTIFYSTTVVLLNSFIFYCMHLLFEEKTNYGYIFASNIAKIFGGGLTQFILLSKSQWSVSSVIRKYIFLIAIFTSGTLILFISLNIRNVYIQVSLFFIFLLTSLFFLKQKLDRVYKVLFLTVTAAAASQYLNALLFTKLLDIHDQTILLKIAIGFLLGLIAPIPYGFGIREFFLVLLLAPDISQSYVLIASAFNRMCLMAIEIILGLFSLPYVRKHRKNLNLK